jgi:AcrR family transcriptional regulator
MGRAKHAIGGSNEQPTTRGRPKKEDEGRVAARVLEAATKLFLEAGFVDTSMDRVAAEAGCSKRTLYSRFPSKSDLFKAVLVRFAGERLAMVEFSSRLGGTTRDRLIAAGDKMLEIVLSSDVLCLQRLFYQEIYKHADLTAIFEAVAREPSKKLIIQILKNDQSQDLDWDKLEALAEHFNTLVTTVPMRQAMSSPGPVRVTDEMRDHLKMTVEFFLRGCGIGTSTVTSKEAY